PGRPTPVAAVEQGVRAAADRGVGSEDRRADQRQAVAAGGASGRVRRVVAEPAACGHKRQGGLEADAAGVSAVGPTPGVSPRYPACLVLSTNWTKPSPNIS